MVMKIGRYNVCKWVSDIYKYPIPKETIYSLNLRDEDVKFFDDLGLFSKDDENIHPASMGTIVDLCTRVILCGGRHWLPMDTINRGFEGIRNMVNTDIDDRGRKIWEDAKAKKYYGIKFKREEYEQFLREDLDKKEELRSLIIRNRNLLTDDIIVLITRLIRYNNYFRAGFRGFGLITNPSPKTIEHIRVMAERSAKFLDSYGNIQCGLYFRSEAFKQTNHIKFGDGDYWNDDVLFDMKVKTSPFVRTDDLVQQIVYYLLSEKSGYNFKKCVMFNPRHGSYFEFDLDRIPVELIEDIKSKW